MVAPNNAAELACDIAIYVSCLMVLGTAVSKISNTLAELRAMNEEHDRQRREIRMYLTSQNAPFELVSRIMKFVDYRLDKSLGSSAALQVLCQDLTSFRVGRAKDGHSQL